MITLLFAVGSLLSFRIRSRASLELEVVALRHQVTVLRRQRPGQPRLFSADRMLWVWLYPIWPQVLNTMVLVKPATVVQWHRKGFRLYWRHRSRHLGRPKVSREICDLIRHGRYLPTEARLTSMPSLSSSPWMRGAPHSGFARLIWRTAAV
jgi:putative transposase